MVRYNKPTLDNQAIASHLEALTSRAKLIIVHSENFKSSLLLSPSGRR